VNVKARLDEPVIVFGYTHRGEVEVAVGDAETGVAGDADELGVEDEVGGSVEDEAGGSVEDGAGEGVGSEEVGIEEESGADGWDVADGDESGGWNDVAAVGDGCEDVVAPGPEEEG
jgi:hypothetical protein